MKTYRYLTICMIFSILLSVTLLWKTTGHSQAEESKEMEKAVLIVESSESESSFQPLKEVEKTPLSKERSKQILDRLEAPLPSFEEDAKLTSNQVQPLPKRSEGKARTITVKTEGELSVPQEDPKELAVVRVAPEKEEMTSSFPYLTITFNQAMIDLQSHDSAATKKLVRLEPEPEGQWRWLGTKTLRFEPKDGFPMSTNYKVTIPAGIKSQSGMVLKEGYTTSFSTSTIKIERIHFEADSSLEVDLDPQFVVLFDQRFYGNSIEDLMFVRPRDGEGEIGLRLLDEKHLSPSLKKTYLAYQGKKLLSGRVAAFKTTSSLKADTRYELVMPANMPSLEGPRRGDKEKIVSFKTYSKLLYLGERDRHENPMGAWHFRFSTPLDEEAFKSYKKQIKVTPAPEFLETSVYGDSIVLRVIADAQAKYQVRFPQGLKDRFSQKMAQEVVVKVQTEALPAMLELPTKDGRTTLLSQKGKLELPIYSTNIEEYEVEVYQVTPKQWMKYKEFETKAYRYMYDSKVSFPKVPGKKLKSYTFRSKKQDQLEQNLLALDALQKEGSVVVLVRPKKSKVESSSELRGQVSWGWYDLNPFAIDVTKDAEKFYLWVRDFSTGKPVKDAQLWIEGEKTELSSDSEGLIVFPLKRIESQKLTLMEVRSGKKSVFLSDSAYNFKAHAVKSSTRLVVTSDRGLYKPGETAYFKGWAMELGSESLPRLKPLASKLSYEIFDSRYEKVTQGELQPNEWGGFSLEFPVEKGAQLGRYSLVIKGTNFSRNESFQVEEFRTPKFKASLAPADEVQFVGRPEKVELSVDYYAGGVVSQAPVSWSITGDSTGYTPAGWRKYHFGPSSSWFYRSSHSGSSVSESQEGVTDALGKNTISLNLSQNQGFPYALRVQAEAQDLDRQREAATKNLILHSGENYVGLRADRRYYRHKDEVSVDWVAVSRTGEVRKDLSVAYTLEKLKDRDERVKIKSGQLQSSSKAQTLEFGKLKPGLYSLSMEVHDHKSRNSRSELTLWVTGSNYQPWWISRGGDEKELTLLQAKEKYRVGEKVDLSVISPLTKSEGSLQILGQDVLKTLPLEFTGNESNISFEIPSGSFDELQVVLVVSGQDEGGKPYLLKKHEYLKVDLPEKRLTIESKVPEKVRPGQTVTLDAKVVDHRGVPVAGTKVVAIAVDEAILNLIGHSYPELMKTFYARLSSRVSYRDNYREVWWPELDDLFAQEMTSNQRMVMRSGGAQMLYKSASPMALAPPAPSMKAEAEMVADMVEEESQEGGVISLRKNWSPLALFLDKAVTDSQGKVRHSFTMPDQASTYRLVLFAVDQEQRVGQEEQSFQSLLPLRIEAQMPRFLNLGDRSSLPMLVHNQSDRALEVELAGRSNSLDLEEEGYRFTVPANDRVEVRFPSQATQTGVSSLDFVAVAKGASRQDAVRQRVPVLKPTTTETFRSYGQLHNGGVEELGLKWPEIALPGFGRLEAQVSSTVLGDVEDILLDFRDYPYLCGEQIASRMLSHSALFPVLEKFSKIDKKDKESWLKQLNKDLEVLSRYQNRNGGYGYWSSYSHRLDPYLSVHVTHALMEVLDRGWHKDQASRQMRMAERYLELIAKGEVDWRYYSERAILETRAYACWVGHRLGKDWSKTQARALYTSKNSKNLSQSALIWLYRCELSRDDKTKIYTFLNNRVVEEGATAQLSLSLAEGDYQVLTSQRKVDALWLSGILDSKKPQALATKLMKGLLGHRNQARSWFSTQESVFVLLAMRDYFEVMESQEPNFEASVWLANYRLLNRSFKGYQSSVDTVRVEETADGKAIESLTPLTVEQKGKGRLYYRLGMTYALDPKKAKAVDRGFEVSRRYEAVDNPSDVKQLADGSYEIKAGAKVKVDITMNSIVRRYHVALVDPLPAGLEVVNPALRPIRLADGSDGAGPSWLRWWNWYSHENYRDEQVEVFSELLYGGTYTYSYTALAITPGEFMAGPVKVHEMYHPENFGRGQAVMVKVVP